MAEYRIDGASGGFWGALQEHYTSQREAEKWAKSNTDMPWRIVKIEERVVASGPGILR